MYGNLPPLTMCAEDRIRWHFIGMGGFSDVFPIYIQGQTLTSRNHRKDTITVFPASLEDAFMVAKGPGEWTLGCHTYGRDLLLVRRTGSEDSRVTTHCKCLIYPVEELISREVIESPFGKSVAGQDWNPGL